MGGSQGGAETLCKEELRRLWLRRLAVFNPACACVRACAAKPGVCRPSHRKAPTEAIEAVLIVTPRAKYGQVGTAAKTV